MFKNRLGLCSVKILFLFVRYTVWIPGKLSVTFSSFFRGILHYSEMNIVLHV